MKRFERIGERPAKPPTPRIDEGAYAGTYRASAAGYTCVVRAEKGKLLVHMTGPPPSPPQPELELRPAAGEHEFEVPSVGARLVFKVAGTSASGFTIHQSGQSLEFQRTEK
jgi:hypothetical protein